ncbi:MAG TPA: M67 family metallopeptidase [Acidimicrobiia bacterium]|jgi:proteasome lid subunit RPN8/RPN11|nr:M67 family metallopeptidase [Acidimicrobiia bacterium]
MSSFAGPLLRLTSHQHAVIVGHCYDGYPDEACGLLTGRLVGSESDGRVTDAVPCVNAARSARTYTVDGRDFLRVSREAEARGDDIVGVWHSHTHTTAYPSPTDVQLAADPMWLYLIVSLRDGFPMLRAYRIRDETIAEIPITIES